jgi:hypothetical protein
MFDVIVVKHIAFAIEQVGHAQKQLDHIDQWSHKVPESLRIALFDSFDVLKRALNLAVESDAQ